MNIYVRVLWKHSYKSSKLGNHISLFVGERETENVTDRWKLWVFMILLVFCGWFTVLIAKVSPFLSFFSLCLLSGFLCLCFPPFAPSIASSSVYLLISFLLSFFSSLILLFSVGIRFGSQRHKRRERQQRIQYQSKYVFFCFWFGLSVFVVCFRPQGI